MRFSHLSSSCCNKILVWTLRFFVGSVFILSGFTKGVDPWGTFYKFTEYASAMHVGALPSLIQTGVFALSAFEFCIGVFILTGCYRRGAVWCATGMMAFMLPLTLWIALADPVNDCGCFGDFVVLSNWATFWKNVVICIALYGLLRWNASIRGAVTPYLQWIVMSLSGIYILSLSFIGWIYQPLLDFRAYPVGEALVNINEGDSEDHYEFLYEKEGSQHVFGENDILPDEEDGWKFVERRIKENGNNKDNEELPINDGDAKTLRIWDIRGVEDVTEEVMDADRNQLLLFMPALEDVTPAVTWKINALHDWCRKNGVEMLAVVNATEEGIAVWKDLSMADYPVYTADDTAIKEVVRGNPGLVLVKEGIIVYKSALTALDADDLEDSELTVAYKHAKTEEVFPILPVMTAIYALCIIGCFIPSLFIHDGKARCAE